MHVAHHLADDEISEEELNEALDAVRAGKGKVSGYPEVMEKAGKVAGSQKDLKKANQNLETLIGGAKEQLQRTLKKIKKDRRKNRRKDVYTGSGEFA